MVGLDCNSFAADVVKANPVYFAYFDAFHYGFVRVFSDHYVMVAFDILNETLGEMLGESLFL